MKNNADVDVHRLINASKDRIFTRVLDDSKKLAASEDTLSQNDKVNLKKNLDVLFDSNKGGLTVIIDSSIPKNERMTVLGKTLIGALKQMQAHDGNTYR